jgi:hypothetical protein
MNRRRVIGLFGIATASAVMRPLSAAADRIRILPSVDLVDPPRSGTPTPAPLRALLRDTRVGTFHAHGALSVFWLSGPAPAGSLASETFDEARSKNTLVITEKGQATVPTLIADNRGKSHVLLLAGEIMLGGKQIRVVAEDVLLPPASGPRNIAVFCVEQGRWAGGPGKEFTAQGSFAGAKLRQELAARPSQDRVWAEVNRSAASVRAASPTSSYQAVFEKPEVQAHQREVAETINIKAVSGAQGAAVFVGERLSGVDLFQDAGLFAREWPKLLRSHALETYDRRSGSGGDESKLREALRETLKAAADAEGISRTNAGIGTLFEFRLPRARGTALVAEGQTVHLAIV